MTSVAAPMTGDGSLVKPCRDNVYKLCPGLAESWEVNSSFTQWTLKMRNNILWHDGTPFTAKDAKFWVELAAYGAKSGEKARLPSFFAADFLSPEKLEVLDGNLLRITLKQPSPLYLDVLTNPRYRIFHPPHLMQPRIEKGEVSVTPQDVGLVGPGPFKFLDYQKGSFAKVRRFDRYWEKDAQGRQLPFLDGIDFALTQDRSTMDAAFRVGKLDGGARGRGFYVSVDRKAAYDRELGDQVFYTEGMTSSGTGFAFNVLRPGPWQDVRVRRAISLWVDRKAAIFPFDDGFGVLTSILTPDNPFTSSDLSTWPGWNQATRERDRAEAKRLLAEAGYAKGFSMNFLVWNQWTPSGEFLKAQLRDLGIDLQLVILDEAGWNRGQLTTDYDAFRYGASGARLPEATEQYMTRHSISRYSTPKHEDPQVVALYDRLRAARGIEARAKAYGEIERYIVLEKVYFAPMTASVDLVPYRSWVKGLYIPGLDAQNNNDMATVWLDK
jgi:peptide/nickel transport system substrate-binding protein